MDWIWDDDTGSDGMRAESLTRENLCLLDLNKALVNDLASVTWYVKAGKMKCN